MATPMSNEKCPRCGATLAKANTNPHRLCWRCQNALGAHVPGSPRLKAWVEAGKPTLPPPTERRARRGGTRTKVAPVLGANVHDLPDAVLIACAKELRRREKSAKAILAALKGL